MYIERSTVHMINLKILKNNMHQSTTLEEKKILHSTQEM